MEPIMGEIKLFAGDFPPRGWMFCDGTLLNVNQFSTLFSLLDYAYGGHGSSFALPDLRGRAPVHPGKGQGSGINYQRGQGQGTETTALTTRQLPAHNHTLLAVGAGGNSISPENNYTAIGIDKGTQNPELNFNNASEQGVQMVSMNAKTIGTAGNSEPVNILSPVLPINYIIAIDGIYPSRP